MHFQKHGDIIHSTNETQTKFIRREQVVFESYFQRDSGWCELLEETNDEIIPEKQSERSRCAGVKPRYRRDALFDAVRAPGLFPEFRWYHGLSIVLIFEDDFFYTQKQKNSVLALHSINKFHMLLIKKIKADSIYVY